MYRKLLIAIALVATLPAASSAQTTVLTEDAVRIERAELLAEQAWIVATQSRNFEAAALQLREAADLFGVDYPAVKALQNAGRFQYYANRKLSAVSTLRVAAETAERIGDFGTASRAFREAAWVAAQVGEVETAKSLLERADTTLAQIAVVALGMTTDF